MILLFAIIAVAILSFWRCDAFVVTFSPSKSTTVPLCMGKGLNRARNKQAEMMKKMELAKQQNKRDSESSAPPTEQDNNDEDEYNRMLFAELLVKSQPVVKEKTVRQAESTKLKIDKPKTSAKSVKRKKKAARPSNEQQEEIDDVALQQGDTAKRRHFESLLDISTNQPLGAMRAAQFVPWVPPFLSKCLVVVSDPRRQSGDLRQAIQYLTSNLPPEIVQQTIVICADSNQETSSWMKRAGVETTMRIFSDVKLEWMTMYSTVVNDERWSMSVHVIDTDGIIQTHERQVDPSNASQLVVDAVKSI